ncbi:MAG: hypothetical protein J6Y42_01870 [Bacilli bacterium]|nr:hypothetical protein [Bacilli bacterium]
MKHKKVLLLFLFVIGFIIFTGCHKYVAISGIELVNKDVMEIKAGEYSFEGMKLNVIYADGEVKEIELTESMIPNVELLKFYKLGEHDVEVVYNRYKTTMKIKVVRHDFDDIYVLNDYTCTYDGMPHRVELNYELPEGAKIDYLYGNTFTNAGEYEVIGVISKDGYNSKTLKATLKIEKADYDLSNVSFLDSTFTYDGEPKTIEATDIPEGIEVSYDIYNEEKTVRMNNAINAGVYKVVAKFSSTDENYNPIPDKEALLTINKASYDMSNVHLDDYEKEYDGIEYIAKLSNESVLPSGVNVTFKYLKDDDSEVLFPVDAGTYKVVASFVGNKSNYLDIPDITSKLVIKQRMINIKDGLVFDSKTINYDRNIHSLEVVGNIPASVTLTYENNDHADAGEYKVIAHFASNNHNEAIDVETMEAFLIINKIRENVKIYDEEHQEYVEVKPSDIIIKTDEVTNEKTLLINGLDLNKYVIYKYRFTDRETNEVTELASLVDGRIYNFEITINFVDEGENNSVILAPVSGEYTYHVA